MGGSVGRGKSEHGQSIIEGTMCLLVICLVLFGLLQIFYISVARMVADFASFQAGRSKAVGFADNYVDRRGRIYAIGASGGMTVPNNMDSTPVAQFPGEKLLIEEYSRGIRWLEYEYWYPWGDTRTYLGVSHATDGNLTTQTVSFSDYPLNFPMKGAFTNSDQVDITGTSQIMYYAREFTDESSE